ncbi:ATPase inhibitor [Pseudogymnoascus australis]
MFRQSIVKATRPATRAFATTARAMGAGDTGSVRQTGSTDAFQKREKAQEDYAIRQREKEKLLDLKKRLAASHDHIKKLEEDIDEFTKNQGGEQK